MKLAISGKGGAGKTTLAALLALTVADRGGRVVAVDADPDANLAATLGFSGEITPLAELRELIAARTGGGGGLVRLNPRVDDIPAQYSVRHRGVQLMVLGAVRRGGAGCACPENSFLRALLDHLLVEGDQWVIVDMEAGIEHLGRGTARGVDAMVVVVEPDVRSLHTAGRILRLAEDVGLRRAVAVGNKVRGAADRAFIRRSLPPGLPLAGWVSFREELQLRGGLGPPPLSGPVGRQVESLLGQLAAEG